MALSLLSLVDEPEVRASIHDELIRQQAKVTIERSHSTEADVLRAVLAAAARAPGHSVAVAAVAREYNDAVRPERPMTAKAAGWFVRERLLLRTVRVRGAYVVEMRDAERLAGLARRFGIETGATMGEAMELAP
jgi:hypothetical protein